MDVSIQRVTLGDFEALGPHAVAARLRALVPAAESVAAPVAEIVAAVREGGDAAVLDYTRRFDTAGREPRPLLVAPEELDTAIRTLPLDVVAGLQVAIANVASVAQTGVGEDEQVVLAQGQRIVVRELPVGAAAVYAPGGRAPYPSTVVMGVVTARAAGVLDVAVCAPPGPDGEIHAGILGTCRLCGVETVYRMGGAQAVAALAHGTETVRRVDVIVGPGNLFVQEAKRQLSGVVGIDGFAGPSDLLVVAAADADPRLVTLDLLAQAEHGPDSLVGVISPEATLLDAVARELELAPPGAHTGAPCALVRTPDVRAALAVANAFAPEHLELVGPGGRAPRPARAVGGVRVRRRRLGHRLRRLRRRVQSRAPHRRRRPLLLLAVAAPLPPTHGRGARRAGRRSPRRGRGAHRPPRGIRGPRGVDGSPSGRRRRGARRPRTRPSPGSGTMEP